MYLKKALAVLLCFISLMLVSSCGVDNQSVAINGITEKTNKKAINGIVALKVYKQDSKMVYEIYSINPETGETGLFNTFSFPSSEQINNFVIADSRPKFSSDYLKMATEKTDSSGHRLD